MEKVHISASNIFPTDHNDLNRDSEELKDFKSISHTESKENKSHEMPQGIGNQGYESLDSDLRPYDESLIIPNVEIYKRRWYMIFIFSMYSMVQCATWNTWGPVSHPAMAVFGWRQHDIAMFANYGCIMIALCMCFFMWILVEKGLRCAMLIATGLSAVGTAIRCITVQNPYATPLMHVGAVLNGMGGPFAQGACTLMSVTWFPPHERITATSIANMANYFGAGLSFIIGPLIVSDENLPDPEILMKADSENTSVIIPADHLLIISQQIHMMLITYAVLSSVVFVAAVIYFPSKPPVPPSTAAQSCRSDEFLSGIKQLMTNPVYWQLALVYAVTLGIYGAWTSVIDVNLMHIGVRQADAAWLGFYSILSGAIFAFITARLNDVFSRHVKLCMVVLFVLATGLFGWFSAIAEGLVELDLVQLYISGITGSAVLCGTIPLLFEVCCELAYPVSEAIASGMQILMFNVVGVVFLSSFFIPNIGTTWMNWLLFSASLLAIPAVVLYKEQYTRLELDDDTERRRTESMHSHDMQSGSTSPEDDPCD